MKILFKKQKMERSLKKFIETGAHFGSRVILEGGRRTGTIIAKKRLCSFKDRKK